MTGIAALSFLAGSTILLVVVIWQLARFLTAMIKNHEWLYLAATIGFVLMISAIVSSWVHVEFH